MVVNVSKLLIVVAILALLSSMLMAGEGCQGGKLVKGADGKIHKVQPKSSCSQKEDLGTNTGSSKFDTSDFLPLDDNEPIDSNSSK